MKLNKELREIICGLTLGDLHIQTQTGGRTFRLCFEQGNMHKEYLFHLYELFRDYVSIPPKQNSKGNWYFKTLTSPSFRYYGILFYDKDTKKKKVPKNIHKFITAKSLAYWYMDDGSIKSKQSKGVFLNTQSFTYREVLLLCDVLKNKFFLDSKPRPIYEQLSKTGPKDYRKKKILYYQIYISGHSYDLLRSLIFDYLITSMYYKFPDLRKEKRSKVCLKSNESAQR